MQINHLPAVKTRCCSAMPFFLLLSVLIFFLFLYLIFLKFYFTALNQHWESIESVQIATWCCFNRNQLFSFLFCSFFFFFFGYEVCVCVCACVKEICTDERACAHVYIKQN